MSELNTSPLSAELVLPTVRKLEEADALLEEQKHRSAEFCEAADAYIQELSAENLQLKAQFDESDIQALQNRLRWFERKYIESQNDVVREQARNLELQKHIVDLESSARAVVPRDGPDSLYPSQPPPFDMQTTQEEAHMQGMYTQDGDLPSQPQAMVDSRNDLGSPHSSQLPQSAIQTSQGVEARDPYPECRDHLIDAAQGLEASEPSPECRDIAMPTAGNGNTAGNLALEISKKENDELRDCETYCAHVTDLTARNLHLRKVMEGLLEERKLLQNLLQQMMNLSLTTDSRARVGSPPKIIFMHPATGLTFKLEEATQDKTLLGGCKETVLEYKVISLGTLVNTAPAWMREDIIFNIDQFHHFLSQLHNAASGAIS
ncbi:unnamed protein product [Sphagnum jensenii]|uniref:DUF7806 domain-containing protein n=1 Tax=Sphagnum jensenii TaxID=128206 RepID=A0ABP0WD15_9BRYO